MNPNLLVSQRNDFSFLDQSEFKRKFADGPDLTSMRFFIEGIHCAKCIRRIESLAGTIPGLNKIRVEMGKNLAHVEIDPQRLSFAQLASHIVSMGYQPIPLEPESSEALCQKSEDRTELIRLAVAAACAGNIMTFAFATYFGASEWETLFRWMSFVLYLPVVTYVALPFYRGAWQSLVQRQISIDLPMAVASVTGFLFSAFELIRGKSDIYFDSLSGFLFLILVSRWTQKRLQRNFLRPQELSETLQLQRVRRIEGETWHWRPLEMLSIDDRITHYAQETLGADAELLSSKAHFSLAWLTGEAKAKTFLRGATIPAGARLLSGVAELQVRRLLPETSFGKTLDQVRKFSLSKNNIVIASDRWAQWLLGTVFIIAIAFLVITWPALHEQAVQRALALIILACPCAMAFGTPLALAVSLRKARRAGLIVRDANVFERASTVRTIFFDKTGTLTDTNLCLQSEAKSVPLAYQKIILSLENESLHPIAFAFRNAFVTSAGLTTVDGFKETPGVGIAGSIDGKFYELRKNAIPTQEIGCTLSENGQVLIDFTFAAQIKADAVQTLADLRQRGYNVVLLSGDQTEAVDKLAAQLKFPKDRVYANASPDDKARVVTAASNAMMVGDGINDSLAMIQADVGIAASGGMETALKVAAVYLSEDGIKGVAALLTISTDAIALIRQNLILSVIYNITGGSLALLGYVNPLVAALLMPISSGMILFSTWLRGRR